jgi:lipopolysaccharide transport system permease protein
VSSATPRGSIHPTPRLQAGTAIILDAVSSTAAHVPDVVIEPERGHALRLGELWAFRELFYFLMWRDVKVRYKQTALGAAWAVLQPLLLMVVFTIFLAGRGVSPKGIPYPVFALAGLVPWTFFASAVGGGANSFVGNSALVSKIYFPRLLIPIAASCSFLLDFAISFVVLLVAMGLYGIAPSDRALLVLPVALYVAIVAVGIGTLLGALNVRYRDVRYAVPFLIQLWLFASPVAYELSIANDKYRWLLALNPMVAGIGGFRWALISGDEIAQGVAAISVVSGCILVVLGFLYFRRVEDSFADVI